MYQPAPDRGRRTLRFRRIPAAEREKRFAPGGIPDAHSGRIVSARPRWDWPSRTFAAGDPACLIRKARSASGLRLSRPLRSSERGQKTRGTKLPGFASVISTQIGQKFRPNLRYSMDLHAGPSSEGSARARPGIGPAASCNDVKSTTPLGGVNRRRNNLTRPVDMRRAQSLICVEIEAFSVFSMTSRTDGANLPAGWEIASRKQFLIKLRVR